MPSLNKTFARELPTIMRTPPFEGNKTIELEKIDNRTSFNNWLGSVMFELCKRPGLLNFASPEIEGIFDSYKENIERGSAIYTINVADKKGSNQMMLGSLAIDTFVRYENEAVENKSKKKIRYVNSDKSIAKVSGVMLLPNIPSKIKPEILQLVFGAIKSKSNKEQFDKLEVFGLESQYGSIASKLGYQIARKPSPMHGVVKSLLDI